MRIAVNTRVLLKGRMEGVARYIYHTTKEMVLAHPEDDFFFFFDRPFDQEFVFADNVHPVQIGFPARHPVLFILWFEWSFYRAVKRHNIDVIYSGDGYLSLRSKVPTLLVSHDLAYEHYPEHLPRVHRWYYNTFFHRFHEYANKIIAVSQATKDDIVAQYGIDANKVSIAYNDTDGSFKKISEQEKQAIRDRYVGGKRFFLYLGAIHPRKNIINIIKGFEVFKSSQQTDYQLVLVGRKAWNNQSLEEVYNNSPFKDDIHFIGNLKEGRELFMASAEALVYVSLFEGFGVPILEAMDAEIPVISSNVSSMPEVCGDAALLVDPTSPDEIGAAMTQLVTDESISARLLKNAKQQRLKFNWSESGEKIYQELFALGRK